MAVIECEPADSEEVENVAWPDVLSVAVPIVMLLSVNVTIPVGVPPLELTVTVKVSGCPARDWLRLDDRVVVVTYLFFLTGFSCQWVYLIVACEEVTTH